MKKIAFILLSTGGLFLMSCNKCKKCEITTSTNTEGVWVSQSVDEKFCEPDIPEEGTVTVGAPGTEVQTSISCK